MSGTFMAAEIAGAGEAIARQLAANAEPVAALAAILRARDPGVAVTIARGSSDHAALYLKHLVELRLGLVCASLGPSVASLYRAPLRLKDALAVTISQSGGSPDIVAMQRAAGEAGAFTLALVNDARSPAATDAEALLELHAGEERSVAATKTMIAALVAGASLVAHWSGDAALSAALDDLPGLLDGDSNAPPEAMADALAAARSLYVLGRGATLAIAAEAALKLKETSAIHAEAFSSAEVLHGPAGVIEPGFPVVAFVPADAARAGVLETIERLASFGAAPLIVDVAAHPLWPTLIAPAAGHELLTPILALHAFYRLAEATARRRGRDPDAPPHLMKVTRTV
jgi:glucosamine--fructose-6-phosphate aminotransferase (isomerizing)